MATYYTGADVSVWQGSINWVTYASAHDFVIIKAGGADSGYYTDGNFATNQAGARAQSGLRIGYYYFGEGSADPIIAANSFLSIVGTLNHGEILVLDIENHAWGVAPDDSWAYDFLTTVQASVGFHPFVYMSQSSPTPSVTFWPTTNPIAPFWMANITLSSTDFSQTTDNAGAPWGGLPAPNYRILQYTFSGTAAGISGAVDLDTFYSPNNTLNDWDILGAGGTVYGIPNDLGTQTPAVSYSQPATQTIKIPKYSYDRILYSTTFTDTFTTSSGSVTRAGPATTINQYAYPIGNFTASINGGTPATNDFGFITAGSYGSYPGNLPTVVVQPIVDSTGTLTFAVALNNLTGTNTIALTINIALMAWYDPSSYTGYTLGQKVAYSSSKKGKTPLPNATYRRIAADSYVGTGATTIYHNQNTIPDMFIWGFDTSNTIEIQANHWGSAGHLSFYGVAIDSTRVYFYIFPGDNKYILYRIYGDN